MQAAYENEVFFFFQQVSVDITVARVLFTACSNFELFIFLVEGVQLDYSTSG